MPGVQATNCSVNLASADPNVIWPAACAPSDAASGNRLKVARPKEYYPRNSENPNFRARTPPSGQSNRRTLKLQTPDL